MEMKQEKLRMENLISTQKIKWKKGAVIGGFFIYLLITLPRQIKQISLKNCIFLSTLIDRLSHRACCILMKQAGNSVRQERKESDVKIYLDVIWLLNFCFDALLLLLTAFILKRHVKKKTGRRSVHRFQYCPFDVYSFFADC